MSSRLLGMRSRVCSLALELHVAPLPMPLLRDDVASSR